MSDKFTCPICLQTDVGASLLTLSCGHALCSDCSKSSAAAGHAACPLCRQPHLLDSEKLKERKDTYREDYGKWRLGGHKGSFGELADLSNPMKRSSSAKDLDVHSASAGDLAVLAADTQPEAYPVENPKKIGTTDDAAVSLATPPPLGFAIVGMGRAGRIHLQVLKEAGGRDAQVRWLVDVCTESCPAVPAGAKVTSDVRDALEDPSVDCVIVSTPTPSHAPIIAAALEAGKHVFAEKPLCCGTEAEVKALFDLATARGRLLHTAYNRRHDPAINEAREQVRQGKSGKPLGASLVSRDFPYPPASYLALSGNIFKDCVVHDLDYLTWLLNDDVVSLSAHATTGDDPAVLERACGMWEYSEVRLRLRSGATATLINGRVSTSYEHRLDVYCEHGAVKVANPYEDTPGMAFSDRFAKSYRRQLAAFRAGVRAANEAEAAAKAAAANFPTTSSCTATASVAAASKASDVELFNLDFGRTMLLEELVKACERSVALGGAEVRIGATAAAVTPSPSSGGSSPRSIEKEPTPTPSLAADHAAPKAAFESELASAPQLRTYDLDTTEARVRDAYQSMRRNQSVEHVRMCRDKYCTGLGQRVRMSVWDALRCLEDFVDLSDPDVTLPNVVHAFQTAEGLRAMGMPDWLQLTGLIHDLGKMVYLKGCDADGTSVATQWSIVGDTWLVGCAMPDAVVFPEFNADSPDARVPERRTETGIYERGCGLDSTLCAFGHDEYMYQVLLQNEGVKLPKEALYVIRYHSLYPWHDRGCYEALESDYDRQMKGWVKLFNQHDLYTKKNVSYTEAEMRELRAYYTTLIDKYLPAQLNW